MMLSTDIVILCFMLSAAVLTALHYRNKYIEMGLVASGLVRMLEDNGQIVMNNKEDTDG